MTEIGKAYIQIVPSMEGFGNQVKSTITGESGSAGESGGKTFGDRFKSAAGMGIKAIGAGIAAAGAAAVALGKASLEGYAEYEQLAGGAQKIFDQMDYSKIAADAQNAYQTMNLSANEYLSMMNSVGATFSQTMGDEKGYETAKMGMQAIADYASGTGKDVGNLNDKFSLITRSASSYQSIADQFSGVLPALSKDFLSQAQAAGFLSKNYTDLTKVPVAEYQQAVSLMLQKGVADLGLANNTINETKTTLSGSVAAMKASWSNLVVGIADENANLEVLINNFIDSTITAGENIIPRVEQIISGLGTLINAAAEKLVPVVVTTIVNNLPQIVQSGVQLVVTLAGALIQALPQLIAAVPEIFRALVSGFQAQWPQIQQAGRDIVTQMGNAVKSLASQALSWGQDLIQNFVNGIKSKISAVGEAMSGVAQKAASFIHFSEPDEGPLSQFHTFAPDMMQLFAKGIIQNLGTVENAMQSVAGLAAEEMAGENILRMRTGRANTMPARNNTMVQTTTKVTFEGSLAPLAMILQPLIEEESARVGNSFAPA